MRSAFRMCVLSTISSGDHVYGRPVVVESWTAARMWVAVAADQSVWSEQPAPVHGTLIGFTW